MGNELAVIFNPSTPNIFQPGIVNVQRYSNRIRQLNDHFWDFLSIAGQLVSTAVSSDLSKWKYNVQVKIIQQKTDNLFVLLSIIPYLHPLYLEIRSTKCITCRGGCSFLRIGWISYPSYLAFLGQPQCSCWNYLLPIEKNDVINHMIHDIIAGKIMWLIIWLITWSITWFFFQNPEYMGWKIYNFYFWLIICRYK